MSNRRYTCSRIFEDRNGRSYRVSFRLAAESTWDHRPEDLSGCEIDLADLWLTHVDQLAIQQACDHVVMRHRQ